jgi:SHAQKYF class myb-like DNA-binding protein
MENCKITAMNFGRWTKEEHIRFTMALKLYGKNWKKIESYVGSRSGAQIRSHAQKFFGRLKREITGVRRRKFSVACHNVYTSKLIPKNTHNLRALTKIL